jgi:hypothetical protein
MAGWDSTEPEINFDNADAYDNAVSPLPEWNSSEIVAGTHHVNPAEEEEPPAAAAAAAGKAKPKKRQTRLSGVKDIVSQLLKDGVGRVQSDDTGRMTTIDRFFDKAKVNTIYRLHSSTVGPFLCQLRSQVKNGVTKRFRHFQLTAGGDVDKFSRFADAVADLLYTTTTTVDDARKMLEKLLAEGPSKPTTDANGRCLLGEHKAAKSGLSADSDSATEECDEEEEEDRHCPKPLAPAVVPKPLNVPRRAGMKSIARCMPHSEDSSDVPAAKKPRVTFSSTIDASPASVPAPALGGTLPASGQTVSLPLQTFVQLVDILNALVRHSRSFSG